MSRIGIRINFGLVDILEKANPEKSEKLEYFRKKILDHLSKLEKVERETINKSLAFAESLIKGGYPVGTIRVWKGKKYVKIATGKWRPKYDSQTRGAKMAISAIKKKIAAAKDEQEMMRIILANRDRFSDNSGRVLPFVQELHNYIEEQKTARKPKTTSATTKDRSGAPKKDMDGRTLAHNVAIISSGTMATLTGYKTYAEIGRIQSAFVKYAENNHAKYNPQDWVHVWEDFKAANDIKKIAETPEDSKPVKKEPETPHVNQGDKEIPGYRKIGDRYVSEDNLIFGRPWEDIQAMQDRTYIPQMIGSEKSSGFQAIKSRYQSAKAIEGDEDEIQIGKDALTGKWKLVEADTPTASHDETTFHKTPGFPENEDGSTINDRDYGHDKAAQEAVMNIGADFDGRALKVDDPVIITKDGIVISGNNRTMSSKIAARKGTDKAYIEALTRRAKKFGFTGDQINGFKNPRVVFEVDNGGKYSTEQFAKFNESGKKEMGPTEKAVKVSKLIKTETVKTVAGKISEFETLGELYANRAAVQHIFAAFKNAGLIGENEAGKYIEEGGITEDGKTFVETALLGSVMNENNIRGFNRPGCKSIRALLVRAITPLIDNKGMDGYSINRELNEAVDIAMQVAINRDKFKSVEDFSRQQSMFEKFDPVSMELAKHLEGTQKAFADFMQKMNGSLKYAASGEADIFLGGVESKDDILSRFLSVKKAVTELLNGIKGFFD